MAKRRRWRNRIRRFFQRRGAGSSVRSFQRTQEKKRKSIRKKVGIHKGATDEWVREQMNNATSGKTSVFSEDMVRSFWALTRDIWNRDEVKQGGRIAALHEFFGTDNMADLMVRAFEEAGDIFESETGRTLDIYKYSVNAFFGVGFFSVG